MTLELKPRIAAALEALASARGLSVEDFLQYLVERELPEIQENAELAEPSGMVWEEGLFVYRTGKALPADALDDALHKVREERARHILGNLP
jgi:methionine salvage enolase-phosphatase E1